MNVTSLSSMDPAAHSCLRSSAVNLVEAKNVSGETFAVDGNLSMENCSDDLMKSHAAGGFHIHPYRQMV